MKWLFTLLMVAGVLSVSSAQGQELEAARLSRNPDHTRAVFDLSTLPEYRISELSEPARVVIDFRDTQLTGSLEGLDLRATPLVGVRSGVRNDSDLRVVLELVSSEVVVESFPLKPYGGRGHRLVVDLYPQALSAVKNVDVAENTARDHQDQGAAVVDAAKSVPHEENPGVQTAGFANTAYFSDAVAETGEDSDVLPDAKLDYEDESGFHQRVEIGGTWEQEWSVYTDGGNSQKFESLVEPRLDVELKDSLNLTAILRFRADTQGDIGPEASRPDNYSKINGPFFNDAKSEFSLREMYLDAEWGDYYWRLGKQQVVWGQADGIKVLDVVNPQSFREFILDDFDDSRIPLTMVNLEMPLAGDSTLQLLWIPDTTYHELAEEGSPYFITSSKLVPRPPDGLATRLEAFNKPDDPLKDSDGGARLSAFVGGWDVTVNYLYHYQDFPVLYQSVNAIPGGLEGVVSPEYERSHLLGGTLSNVLFGDLTLRAELAYNSDTFHVARDLSQQGIENSSEAAGVVGLDWQPGSSTMISGQYFHSQLLDYVGTINRDKTERNASLYFQQSFINETLQFSGLLLYSVNHEDTWTQLKLKYVLRSNLELWLGADLFSGDRDGLFGQFTDYDRALVGMKLGF
jgi:hypothetical protein